MCSRQKQERRHSAFWKKETVSFVILDLMLPDISGEEICSRIRRQSRIPIIMLTAKTMEDDMLNGLNLGADDYITKPFSLKNLYARIQAVWRRSDHDLKPLAEKFSWNAGDLVIDYNRKEVLKKGGKLFHLPPLNGRSYLHLPDILKKYLQETN